jgi:hypothetical protein
MTKPIPNNTKPKAKPILSVGEEADLLKIVLSEGDNLTAATRLLEIHYQSLESTMS